MKKKLTIALMMVTGLMACTSEEDGEQRLSNDGAIRFVPEMVSDWNAPWTTRAEAENSTTVQALQGADGLYLHSTVSKSFYKSTANDITRGTKYLGVDDGDGGKTFAEAEKFYVSGYRYAGNSSVSSVSGANFLNNAPITNSGGQWRAINQSYVMPAATDKIDFFAWFVADEVTAGVTAVNAAGGLQLTYTVPSNIENQPDLLAAVTRDESYDSQESYTVPLAFSHQLTAVNFVLDENVAPGTITEIAFLHVYTKATLSIGGMWDTTHGNAPNETAYAMNFTTVNNNVLRSGETLIANLMMIPQLFTENNQQIRIKITIDDSEKTLYANLKGTRWEPSTTVTYKISTTSVVPLNIGTINYPTDWGGERFEPADSYADATEMGIYVVDTLTRKVIAANTKLIYDQTTDTWSTENNILLNYNTNYNYFLYYPYRQNVSGGKAVEDSYTGNSAVDFFSTIINNWTIAEDLSTTDKLLANDLHIGMATHDANTYTRINTDMQHALGLVKIALDSVDITPRIRLVPGNPSAATAQYRVNLSDSVFLKASNLGIKDYMWTDSHEILYYYIVKGAEEKTFMSTSTGDDQWKESLKCNISNGSCYTDTAKIKTVPDVEYDGWYFDYTGGTQSYTLPAGTYRIECWGASGGNAGSVKGGNGGYTSGDIQLTEALTIYIFVGQQGQTRNSSSSGNGGWNGGGRGINTYDSSVRNGDGGGATDIRIGSGNWNDAASRRSRIMVAGAGGGACNLGGGHAGGLTGYRYLEISWSYNGSGGTQTQGGIASSSSFGTTSRGGFGYGSNGVNIGGGGGGGYYGGGGGCRATTYDGSGGGGSSFISGHTGCNAITSATSTTHTGQPNHYSGYVFTNTEMIDGIGYEWTTTAGTTVVGVPKTTEYGREAAGHIGNGFVRITKLEL